MCIGSFQCAVLHNQLSKVKMLKTLVQLRETTHSLPRISIAQPSNRK